MIISHTCCCCCVVSKTCPCACACASVDEKPDRTVMCWSDAAVGGEPTVPSGRAKVA